MKATVWIEHNPLRIMLGTLFQRPVVLLRADGRRIPDTSDRGGRGKVQLTFWHRGWRGRDGLLRVDRVCDEVLGAFVLGGQVKFDGLAFVAALFQAAVVQPSRRRHWLVFRAAGADDAARTTTTGRGRVNGCSWARTAGRVEATIGAQGRCAAVSGREAIVAPPLTDLDQVVDDQLSRLGLSGATLPSQDHALVLVQPLEVLISGIGQRVAEISSFSCHCTFVFKSHRSLLTRAEEV